MLRPLEDDIQLVLLVVGGAIRHIARPALDWLASVCDDHCMMHGCCGALDWRASVCDDHLYKRVEILYDARVLRQRAQKVHFFEAAVA